MRSLSKVKAKKRIEQLKKIINYHRYLYHVLDRQEISDAALDSLKKELFDLEQQFPDLITPDSPTQRIGGKPLDKFAKVRHESKMLSLNDAFSEQDIYDWIKRIENFLGHPLKTDFYCDPKMDGLAIELIYNNGILTRAATRGDGVMGEDVTQNVKTIEAIPLKLRNNYPKHLVVRGEIFLDKKEFQRINRELKKAGKKTYANPRNLAAGSVRQLNPKITASRHLDFFAYDVLGNYATHKEKYYYLRKYGIKTNPHGGVVKSVKGIFFFFSQLAKKREKLAYEIDGMVVSVNGVKLFDRLGVVGKAPRGAIAYKFSPKEAATVVEDIKVQMGRTGKLTPVAALKPVAVGGVTITNATLHNENEIKELDIRIGDTVIVSRAGDVIPQITKVLKKMRTGNERKFHMPNRCPLCNSPIIKKGAYHLCSNRRCRAVRQKYLYYFVSKPAFDIEGLGPQIIDRFVDENLINDAADIFDLKEGDIEALKGFGKKSAANIVKEIKSRKKIPLVRFLYALGIPNVGEETAVLLAETFFNRQSSPLKPLAVAKRFQVINLKGLESVKDIGPIVARGIYDWFHDKRNIHFLEKLEKAGIIIKPKTAASARKLRGLTFVLTGALTSMPRSEAKEKIRSLDGNINESVSKDTDYVVVGKDPGSKYDKAKKLGVKMINEKVFLRLLK